MRRPTPIAQASLVFALLSGGLAGTVSAVQVPESLDACEALVERDPDDTDAYVCFTDLARRLRQWDEAARRLDALLGRAPDRPAARLQLAWIERDRGGERAASLFRQAARGFARLEDAAGEVHALVGLAYHLRQQGNTDAAAAESARASVVAERAADPVLVAWVRNQQGNEAYDRGDFESAARLFREAEAKAFPDGPADLRGYILNGLGNTAAQLGEDRQAMGYYDRWADILERTGNPFQEAYARYNVGFIAYRHLDDWSSSPEEVRGLVLEALELARRSGNRDVESGARLQLGRDVGLPLAERIEHLERALEIQRTMGQARTQIAILRQLAQYRAEADDDPTAALALASEAVDLAGSGGSLIERARARESLAAVKRKVGTREEAITASLAALEAIENVRDLQRDDLVKARYLAQWDFAYYGFADYLLDAYRSSRSRRELELAFGVMERLRGRALLDTLDAAGATAASPAFAALRRPDIPSLAEIADALGDDQALLAFQLATSAVTPTTRASLARSWVVVVTRREVAVVTLEEPQRLRQAVDLYLGLLEQRTGAERRPAVRLYDRLLREAVGSLPDAVRRLVIVPDGILHRLPWSTLRPSADAPPIAVAYELTLAPSATIWMRARERASRETAALVLALADPTLPGIEEVPDRERQTTLEVGLELGGLPHARAEGRAMLEALGGRGTLRTGGGASERYLKRARLADFRIVHLAAHAIVDEDRPERSAILLAPGAETEDGLLQIREVVDLDLDGSIVLLSACRSASGRLVAGEGVVGLARAFLQAGARTVIGGLWPLRDDETAAFVADFSRHLARGLSVGAALAEARRDGIRAGAPPAAWAGLVLLGDGDTVPVPGGVVPMPGDRRVVILAAALLVVTLLLIVAIVAWRRRAGTDVETRSASKHPR